jgi:NADH-quinone oxidoreductase subunit N
MNLVVAYLPMIVAVLGAVASMLLGAWGHRAAGVWTVVAGLILGALLVGVRGMPLAGTVGGSLTDATLIAVCLWLGAIVIAACSETLSSSETGIRIASLGALAAAASALLASTHDVLTLFLAVETLALLGYGMVALGETHRAREAAMKWFIQGSIATAFFIIGLGVMVGVSGGKTGYSALMSAASIAGPTRTPLAVGFVLIIAALAFKAGAFPFHSWMPDAFETAPPAATAILASAGKVAPIAALMYLVAGALSASGGRLSLLVAAISLASITFGNLAALRQRSLARMLAYSGVAQIGYALTGLMWARSTGSVLYFAVFYAVAAAAGFVFVVALREAEPTWDGSIAGLAGLSRRRPLLAVSLAVVMFSMTGIPLTAGFWGKYLVFTSAIAGGFLWLAIAGMIGSVVSFAYYGNVLRVAFMEDAAGEGVPDAVPATPAGPDAVPATPAGSPTFSAQAATSSRASSLATAMMALLILGVGILPFVLGLSALGGLFG